VIRKMNRTTASSSLLSVAVASTPLHARTRVLVVPRIATQLSSTEEDVSKPSTTPPAPTRTPN
jgi:hypothetical protein